MTAHADIGDITTSDIAAGRFHAVAARSDGTVWSWGTNDVGELGVSNVTYTTFPIQIPGLSNIVNVASGGYFSLALQSNGSVWAWGTNNHGQLGNGTTTSSIAPVKVTGISNAVAIGAGAYHSLAVLANGQVMAWGANQSGQLGNGTFTQETQPVLVSTLTNAVEVKAGYYHSLALTASGQAWIWGGGTNGQLGGGYTTGASAAPTQISSLSNITSIAAGAYHNVVLNSNGTVWAWGDNAYGEVGIGNSTNTVWVPTQLSGIGQVELIGAGFYESEAIGPNPQQPLAWGYVAGDTFYTPIPLAVSPTFAKFADGYYASFALANNGDVWAWGYNGSGNFGNGNLQYDGAWTIVPALAFPATASGRVGQFIRGNPWLVDYCTQVDTADLEAGIALNPTGNNAYSFSNTIPWFLSTSNQTVYQLSTVLGTTTQTAIAQQNPIVAFGSRGTGTPLYINQPYRFDVYAGGMDESTASATNVVQIAVYSASNFVAGATNVAPLNTFTIPLPRRTVAADSNNWNIFMTNGASATVTTNGLTTTVQFIDGPATQKPMGLSWLSNGTTLETISSFDLVAYEITHTASTTNYFYKISVLGKVQTAASTVTAMGTNSAGTWTALPLYSLDFDARPPMRSIYVDRLFFQGTPMPPTYSGDTPQEITNGLSALVTNGVTLTNSAYTNLDASPELRRHPILDQFVQQMNKDPLALASYVINQIDLTDPYDSAQSNQVVQTSVNCGGVDRSALGTFLEGEGSPIEQCALLVYFLRQAGYPAAYVFPTNGNLLIQDSRISQLWQIQVQGVVNYWGVPWITNSLVTVNYPWVVANIPINGVTNTVHIFPWLKDYEIDEGFNLYDYMPTNYNTALKWIEQYVRGNPSIMSLDTENVPYKLFPKFVQQCLLTNPASGTFSLDDLGVKVFNRPHNFPTWAYLPMPDLVTNFSTATVVDQLGDTNTFHFLTNMFNTAEVQIWSTSGSTSNKVLDTGTWKMCDFNDRQFLLFTNGGGVALWLAPYSSNVTSQQVFSGTNTEALQSNWVSISGWSNMVVAISHVRQLATLSQPVTLISEGENDGETNIVNCTTADLAAICFDIGRVTPAMIRPYANTYWSMEQARATNTSYMPPVQNYQGTAAFLLGMQYLEDCDNWDILNRQFHKIKQLYFVNSGIAKIESVSGTVMQAKVDFIQAPELIIGNASLQPQNYTTYPDNVQNYAQLMITGESAYEAQVIQDFFQDPYAVSTVRLLQLAQQQTNSGKAPLVELFQNDYVALGNQSYTGYGTTLLKNQDTSVWNAATNLLAQWDGTYGRVIMTPGPITNGSRSYSGMAALILDMGNLMAEMSGNNAPDFGGDGSDEPNFNPASGSDLLPWLLYANNDSSYTFAPDQPGSTYVAPVLSTIDEANLVSPSQPIDLTPSQNNEAQQIAIQQGQSPPANQQQAASALNTGASDGSFGSSTGWMQTAWQAVEDPVDPVSGGFYVDAADLTLPGPFPLQLRRNYLSQNATANQFGYGWKINFMPYLVLTTNASNQSVIYGAELDGTVIAYHQTNTSTPWVVLPQDNPSLNNNSKYGKGSTANLFNSQMSFYNTNGGTYIISAPDGSTRIYEMMTSFGVTSGTNQLSRIRPYLTEWIDHAGNYALFSYGANPSGNDYGQLNGIKMANGNSLVFQYDFLGRIYEAFTGDGRFVQYTYDNYGDLISVTLPDNSQCQYQYQHYTFLSTNGSTVITNTDSTHLMIQEIKPNGRIVANNYDSLDRVITQASTVGTNLALITNGYFFYTNNVTSVTNQFASGLTCVQDVFHNPTYYYYTNNLITNTVNPRGFSSVQVWFPDTTNGAAGYYPRSLAYTIDNRGLTNQFYYNNLGSVTNMVVMGNITGEGNYNQSATYLATYTTNNMVQTTTDPIGNGMQFTYDTADPYRVTQAVRTSSSTPVSTNLFYYTNVSQLSTIGTTNFAYGVAWRKVIAGATNDFAYNGQGFLTEQIQYTATLQNPADTDPSVIIYFDYNERGQLYESQVQGGGTTQMTYDAMGRLTSRMIYDQNGNLVSTEFWYYNQNGELEWYQGPRSNPQDYIWYGYDGAGRVIQQINWRSQGMLNGGGVEAPDGYNAYATTFKTYDGFGNLVGTIDPRGVTTENGFDALGELLESQVFDTNGVFLTSQGFAYEPGGKVAQTTNALGGVTTTLYTQTGQPCAQTNPDESTNGWTYYLDGRLKQQFLPNASYWFNTYDDVNLLTTRTFYSGGTTLSTNVAGFDPRGNQILTVDAMGNPFTNAFDGLNRVKFTAGPMTVSIVTNAPGPGGGNFTNVFQQAYTNYYGSAGLATTNFNGLGESTITYRDVLGRVTDVEIHDAANNLVRIATTTYSADHESQTVTQGSGSTAVVTTIYTDNANKPVLTISYPSSGVEEFILDRYDSAENMVSETHNTVSGGTVTTWTTASFVVDGLNRVISKTDRDGAVTTYGFDAASNPTNQVIPGGLIWRAAYNSARQKLYDCDVGSGNSVTRSNSYTYKSTTGLLQTKTDGRGVTCTRYYDSFLRPASNVYSGPLPEHNLTTTFYYDPRNIVTNVAQSFASTNTGPAVSVTRMFDAYSELVSDTISGGNSYAANQGWNAAGRRTGLGIGTFGYGFGYQADGLLTGVGGPTGYGGGSFTYGTSGLLLSRTFSPRVTSITQYDGDGRPLAVSTVVNGTNVLSENLTFTPDGLLATHTVRRPDFTDNRSYTYANLSRRLTQEIVGLSATANWTNAIVYDNGVAGGPGALTSIGQPVGTNVTWKGSTDAFSRVAVATNSVAQREAYGFLNGTATMTALLDGNAMPVTLFGTNDSYEWRAQLQLLPGPHKLVVNALNWSGFFTASATNTFTNNAADHVQATYAGNGEVTNRVWISSNGQTNATQSLSFDAQDRLHGVTYLDSSSNGYIWSAVYDGLGRRMSTMTIFVTNGVALTNLVKTIGQFFDPQVTYLEVGEADSGATTWKFYGPDLNGVYGGMQGVGGLEAVVNGPRESSPIINDIRGNALGLYNLSQAAVTLFPSRVTAYGAVPGYAPLPLADGAKVAQSSAFRDKWPDITGLYYFGARYYDPTAGNWMSFDPAWNGRDPNGFTFCGGDPINFLDPRGRIGTKIMNGIGSLGLGDSMMAQYQLSPGTVLAEGAMNTIVNSGTVYNNALSTGSSSASAYYQMAGYFFGNLTGFTPLYQGVSGTDVATGQALTGFDRGLQTVTGSLAVIGTGFAGQGLVNSYMNSAVNSIGDFSFSFAATEGESAPLSGTASTTVTSPTATVRASVQGTYVDPLSNEPVTTTQPLAADHIYPQSLTQQMPGFNLLTPQQQSAVLNNPNNIQGLPQTFNASKGAQLNWTTYKGQPLNPAYINNLIQQQNQAASELQQQILDFLDDSFSQ
jgi:RHS repeat-associated protein